jgi:hypothetical protein
MDRKFASTGIDALDLIECDPVEFERESNPSSDDRGRRSDLGGVEVVSST